ncbi:hypothetical protein CTI14_02720 [Methylobacterium radiotolerans]|nr:PAS domain-containing protein [Methylobacterium radiotolerans]PJI55686.1 hypothetical protein CTI14_02720 [Methylobacterium radiotolerans]
MEFELDGTVVTANANFLAVVGYGLDEVKGKHHSMFVDGAERGGAAYRAFWDALGRGEFQQAEYKRVAKGGRAVYIQATYNPVRDASGRLVKVVKFATDVTASVEERLRRAELQRGIDHDLDGIAASISQASQQAVGAAGAAEQASGNTQGVAAGAEELAASVGEISRQVSRALQITGRAVEQANATSTVVAGLASAAQRIGDVVGMIDDIAGQTNLLATSLGERLRDLSDADTVAAVVAETVGRALGLSRAAYGAVDRSEGHIAFSTGPRHI